MDLIQKEQILEDYCSNNMKKLEQVSRSLFKNYGGIEQKDHADFFSIANELIWKTVDEFDESKNIPFENYFKFKLNNKFKTEITRRNRLKNGGVEVEGEDGKKRKIAKPTISIDESIEDGINLCEKIDSGFRIEDEVSEEIGFSTDEKTQKYLKSLSAKQRQIANLIMEGYTSIEIRKKLELTEKQYISYFKDMSCFEKSRILKHKDYIQIKEDEPVQTQTSERSKERQYSIASLIKKIDGYTFRFDHPTQRESGRWSSKMKGNLISDILQNNPLPHLVFAEQIIDGVVVTWNLDGKQKSTNVYDFYNNKFKICKNIRRCNIEYQSFVKDENGKVVLLNSGLPQIEQKVIDIRGKKFSDLPDELQERFCDYTFQCTQYLNCSDEDIEYHICRYNEGKPLNGSEKGMGEIGTKYAAMVKEIAAMPFFTDCGGYKMAEFKNGTVNRVVVESIMAINFLNDWKKQQEEMCSYMKENATDEIFDNFTDMVERLETVITDEISEMFNSKDSFIYFSLFAKFIKTGLDDKRFIDFMTEFNQSLHNKVVAGITYEELCVDKETGKSRSTKDKYIVIPKIELLEKLMMGFLHCNIEETQTETVESNVGKSVSVIDFVKENVEEDIDEIDVQCYENDFEVYSSGVDGDSNLLNDDNKASLVAIVAYACQKEVDDILQDWFIEFFKKNTTYIKNQKENYLNMKSDLTKFIQVNERMVAAG